MNEPYWCPKEGCDYGSNEQKSLEAVRSHANASADHDWSTLKPLVEQQTDEREPDESSDEAAEDDGGDEDDDQQASTDTAGEEATEAQEESNDMVSEEEYEQAHGDATSTDSEDTTSQTSDPVGSMLPTLDTSTIAIGLAVLGALVVLWMMLGDDDQDDQQEATVAVRQTDRAGGWSPEDIEEVAA
jgi:hypothetical protein